MRQRLRLSLSVKQKLLCLCPFNFRCHSFYFSFFQPTGSGRRVTPAGTGRSPAGQEPPAEGEHLRGDGRGPGGFLQPHKQLPTTLRPRSAVSTDRHGGAGPGRLPEVDLELGESSGQGSLVLLSPSIRFSNLIPVGVPAPPVSHTAGHPRRPSCMRSILLTTASAPLPALRTSWKPRHLNRSRG